MCAIVTAEEEGIFKSKPVNKLKCWRFGLSRTGVNNTKGVPSKTGEKWRSKIGDSLVSSPVLYEGIIYVGSDKGFFALDAETGKEIWNIPVKNLRGGTYGSKEGAKLQTGVESSACVADGVVYFTGCDSYTYAADAKTGEVKWKKTFKKQYLRPVTYSPGVAYGLVFTHAPGYLAGLDVKTGKEVWKSERFNMPKTAGITMNDSVIAGLSSAGDGCSVLNIDTGLAYDWVSQSAGDVAYCRATPAIVNGKIYGTSVAVIGTAPRQPKVGIWNLNTSRGGPFAPVEPHLAKKDRKAVFSSPTVWEGNVYSGTDSGFLYVFDDEKLKPLWNVEIGSVIRSSASISSQDGILYLTAYDGKIYAIAAKNGDRKWEHKISKPVTDFTEINSCPWVEDGVVYIGTFDGDIIAIH